MLQGLSDITTYAIISSAMWSTYSLTVMEMKLHEETKNHDFVFLTPMP